MPSNKVKKAKQTACKPGCHELWRSNSCIKVQKVLHVIIQNNKTF